MNAYTFHITLYDLLFLAAIFTGATVSVQLWFTKSVNQTANRWLSLALGIVVLWLFWMLGIDIGLSAYFPYWSWLPLRLSLAIGPLIYFYVRTITQPAYTFRWKELLHLSPLLLELGAQMLELRASIKTGTAIYDTQLFHALDPICKLLAFISVAIYLHLSHRLIQGFYERLQFKGGDRNRIVLRWLTRLLTVFAVLWVLWIPFTAVGYFFYGYSLSVHAYYPLYLALAAAAIWMAAAVYVRQAGSPPAEAPLFVKQPLPAGIKQKGRWLKKITQDKLYYQDPELNLSLLAGQLGLSSHELSRIINMVFKKSFNDFINEYRVKDVARKMQDPAYDQITLLGIAYEAGFNSKATFIRAFKQLTGKSPAAYKRELEKEVANYRLQPPSGTRQLILVPENPLRAHEPLNRPTMFAIFRNYLKLAWRSTVRSFSYSVINMLGLAAGLCSFIVILLYMNYELSYDKWSPELDKVYRVSLHEHDDFLPNTPAPLADFLAQKYPNAEAATMLQSAGDRESLIAFGDKKFYQKDVVGVDSNFLKVFPYTLAVGNAATALNAPRSAILTKELSHKLFGNENPLGKQIRVNDRADLSVTGVLEDQPVATHLPVGLIIHQPFGRTENSWNNYSYQTYVKLKRAQSDTAIETTINRLYYNDRLKAGGISFESYTKAGPATYLFVDQVPRLHNFSKHGSNNFANTTILLVLAVLLLLAGAINFSNLAIAKSISRAKEVGIRKVMGSNRKQLILQFMSETALQCFISLAIAVMLLAIALPYINTAFNIGLRFWGSQAMLRVVLELAGCLLMIILLSGLYPAFYLSKFNPVKVLKGDYSSGKKAVLFRNSLIVVQFMVSVFFITGIIVIKSQISFMQKKDKGFAGGQLIRIESRFETLEQGFENTRNMLLSVPGVVSVAKTTKVPGDNTLADTATVPFKNNAQTYRMSSVKVSTDYFKTIGASLKKGRLFTNEGLDQQTGTAIINETAAKKMALENPIGQLISFSGCDSTPMQVVGVVRDFNVRGFESEIQPVVYTIGNNSLCLRQFGGAILVKLDSRRMQHSIAGISQAWKKIEPAFPIRYSFIDQNFEQLFISYLRLEKIITFFGIVAIMISVMGLFALATFFIRQRTKEIGIRKILGASAVKLATLLGKDFVYLVFLSVVIITPISWWMVQKWLQSFVYRIHPDWWMFVIAGLTAIVIAVITVSFQSVKAALANPADSLRSE